MEFFLIINMIFEYYTQRELFSHKKFWKVNFGKSVLEGNFWEVCFRRKIFGGQLGKSVLGHFGEVSSGRSILRGHFWGVNFTG